MYTTYCLQILIPDSFFVFSRKITTELWCSCYFLFVFFFFKTKQTLKPGVQIHFNIQVIIQGESSLHEMAQRDTVCHLGYSFNWTEWKRVMCCRKTFLPMAGLFPLQQYTAQKVFAGSEFTINFVSVYMCSIEANRFPTPFFPGVAGGWLSMKTK